MLRLLFHLTHGVNSKNLADLIKGELQQKNFSLPLFKEILRLTRLRGQRRTSLFYCEQYIACNPLDIFGYENAIREMLVLKMFDEALDVLNQMPDAIASTLASAELHEMLGDERNANRIYRDHLSNNSLDGLKKQLILHKMAQNYVLLGDMESANQTISQINLPSNCRNIKVLNDVHLLREYSFAMSESLSAIENADSLLPKILKPDKLMKQFFSKCQQYTDIVLIANNPSLRLSSADITKIQHFTNPLFVFMNKGNPWIKSTLQKLWSGSFYEALICRQQFLVAPKTGEYYYSPISSLGLQWLLFSGGSERSKASKLSYKFCEKNNVYWFPRVLSRAIKLNYSRSTYFNKDNKEVLKYPSQGWQSSILFMLLQQDYPEIHLHLAGFDLTDHYILNIGIANHDFLYERKALSTLYDKGYFSRLGYSGEESKRFKIPVWERM